MGSLQIVSKLKNQSEFNCALKLHDLLRVTIFVANDDFDIKPQKFRLNLEH